MSRYVLFNDDVRVPLFNVRNLRNFGVIRSSVTDEALRLAPNFNNNQAYLANPSGTYSAGMLSLYMKQADSADRENLGRLTEAMKNHPYLRQAKEAGSLYLKNG